MKYQKDYYRVLGVERNASPLEIRRAYRRLAILNHPDRNPGSQSNARMQEINEAYDVIGDQNKRAKYDAEYFYATSAGQTHTAPNVKRTVKVEPPTLFDDHAPAPLSFLAWITIEIFVVVSLGFLGWSLTTLNFVSMGTAFMAVLLGSLAIAGILNFWKFFKSEEKKAQCPQCEKLWAAEKLGEKLTGVFQKNEFAGVYENRNERGGYVIYSDPRPYERYKIHCKCKYCGYEWMFLESRKSFRL